VTGDRQRVEAVIHGRVQGVGFRYHVVRAARDLGLVGWVANEPSGAVRCVAEGPRWALERLVEVVREGPRGAHVDRVDVEWPLPSGSFTAFDVRSGGHPGD
jgi:acylphosphatase